MNLNIFDFRFLFHQILPICCSISTRVLLRIALRLSLCSKLFLSDNWLVLFLSLVVTACWLEGMGLLEMTSSDIYIGCVASISSLADMCAPIRTSLSASGRVDGCMY